MATRPSTRDHPPMPASHLTRFLQLLTLCLLPTAAAAAELRIRDGTLTGPDAPASVTLDLLRGRHRLYVEAELTPGRPVLFLLDSVDGFLSVSSDFAKEINLTARPLPKV